MLLLLLGFTLFLHSLRWNAGLPYCQNWDEPQIVQPAIRVIRNGIYIPSRFDYGPANTFLHAGWMAANFLSGSQKGKFPNGIWEVQSDRESGWYWSVSSPFLWQRARLLSSLLVLGALAFTALAGRKLGGAWCGITAGTVMALVPSTYQSGVVVSPDALALMAAALSLWLSAIYWREGGRWMALGAALGAALAASSKYNYAVVAAVPATAHLLRMLGGRERVGTGLQVACAAAFLGGIALFLSPAFWSPTKFLHDVSAALGFYVAKDPMPVWLSPVGYLQKVMALLHGGDFNAKSGLGGDSGQNTVFSMRAFGIPAVAVFFVGVWYGLTKVRGVALLVSVPVVVVLLAAGPDAAFYFTRYLLPALPCIAVLCGIGVVGLGHILARRYPVRFRSNKVLVLLVVALPLLLGLMKNAWPAQVETRVQLSQWMLKNLPPKSRLWIAQETRWFLTPEEGGRFKISMGTLAQAMHTPPSPAEVDYLVLPGSVELYSKTFQRPRLVEAYNQWLQPLKPFHEISLKTRVPVYFGRPTSNPHIIVVRAENVPQNRRIVPTNSIPGPALKVINGSWMSTQLADGPLSLRPGPWVEAPVRLTSSTLNVRLTAQGTSPIRQLTQPGVTLELFAADGTSTVPLRVDFNLDRSQGGLQAYTRILTGPLAAGNYIAKAKVSDMDGLPVNIELLEFTP